MSKASLMIQIFRRHGVSAIRRAARQSRTEGASRWPVHDIALPLTLERMKRMYPPGSPTPGSREPSVSQRRRTPAESITIQLGEQKMLHLSYLFRISLGPFGAGVAGAVGAAAIGAGADPTELMEDAGMSPETRADHASDEPFAKAPGTESAAAVFGSTEPVATMIRVR